GFHDDKKLNSESWSRFGQGDIHITDGLTLTLGGNWTDDRKNFRTNVVSSDVFSNINFAAPQYAPFRQQLLFQGAVAQTVGNALGLGRPATAAEIGAFAGA